MTDPTPLAQLTEPLNRVSELVTRTDGRTDGRTESLLTVGEHLAAVDAGATNNQFSSFGRYKVVRTGEREPIPYYVRSAVYLRDDGRCDLCGNGERVTLADGGWELDHMVPWSAGGSDDSTNLRVLCVRHNQERSNWHDMSIRHRRPVTWWCINCYSEDDRWEHYPGAVKCYTHLNTCPVQRGYDWALRNGELSTWHDQPAVTSPTTLAFCAHCSAPGMTDKPL